jgi:TnpA family transposase
MLSATERESLLALPDTQDELIRRYTLSNTDMAIIRQRRGAANRLGFAVQLCYMRYPGIVLGLGELPFPLLLHLVAAQLKIPVEKWGEYGDRDQTRREHMVDLQTLFGFRSFTTSHHRAAVQDLAETALQTDTGIVLAGTVVEKLRAQAILLPRLNAIERICAEAVTRANRHINRVLTDALSVGQRTRLDDLLKRREGGSITSLA